MKICSTCKTPKLESEFNKNKSRKDNLNTICKICSRERSKRYYKENPVKHKENVKSRKLQIDQENQTKVIEYLLKHPCIRCNESDILTLEFDHIVDKEINICTALQLGWTWKRIEKEISKCQVLCANCHRRKSHMNCGSYKWKYLISFVKHGS